jgi:hypothetical protein
MTQRDASPNMFRWGWFCSRPMDLPREETFPGAACLPRSLSVAFAFLGQAHDMTRIGASLMHAPKRLPSRRAARQLAIFLGM